MRLVIAFVMILGMLPALVRWTVNGNISISAIAALAVLAVVLIAIGGNTARLVLPLIALCAFGLQYAPAQTLAGFWSAIAALLPLTIALFGVYIIITGFRGERRRPTE